MITWQQLISVGGALLPFAAVLVAIGMYRERLTSLRADFDALRTAHRADVDALRAEHAASAKDQGRRVGNLESFTGLTADGVPVERMGGGLSGRIRGTDGDR